MKILVFGATGMLGQTVVRRWAGRFDVYAAVRGTIPTGPAYAFLDPKRTLAGADAFDHERVRAIVQAVRPNVVFNAVGVIKQLESSKNTVTALTVNSVFPHRLAEYCAESGARLITVSTDCVFSGRKGMYRESDAPDATDLYGVSKRLGEVVDGDSLTLRTSIIGPEIGTSHSLLEWFLSNRGGEVKGFRKAIYSGFPTVVLADIVGDVIEQHPGLRGLYHLSSEPINKFDLLTLFSEAYDVTIGIEPDDSLVIDRSLDSSRFRAATGFSPPAWRSLVETMARDHRARGQNP